MALQLVRSFVVLGASITLGACTSARPIMAPSGQHGLKIWCEMPSQCYDRAAKECPNGYTIEAKEKDYWGLGDVDGNLFIVCKAPGLQGAGISAPRTSPATQTPPSSSERCEACERISRQH